MWNEILKGSMLPGKWAGIYVVVLYRGAYCRLDLFRRARTGERRAVRRDLYPLYWACLCTLDTGLYGNPPLRWAPLVFSYVQFIEEPPKDREGDLSFAARRRLISRLHVLSPFSWNMTFLFSLAWLRWKFYAVLFTFVFMVLRIVFVLFGTVRHVNALSAAWAR